MNRTTLINKLRENTKVKESDVRFLVNEVFEIISQTLLEGEDVTITGFGSFKVAKREPRLYYNMRTGEKQVAPLSHKVKFKWGKTLKDLIRSKPLEV